MSNTMNYYHRKGSAFGMIVTIAIILAILWITFTVLNKTQKNVTTGVIAKTTCGGIVGTGECKSDCGINPGIQKFKNSFGCPPKDDPSKIYCCISLEGSTSESYGQNDKYLFTAEYVGISTTGCKGSGGKYNCPAGKIQLYIKVTNNGKETVEITPAPKVVQTDPSPQKTSWPPSGTTITIAPGNSEDNINAGEFTANAGETYKVYPAAKCISAECKAAAAQVNENQIFSINEQNYLIITIKTP